MDIKLVSSSGFPQDGIISIRAGAVRRQAVTSSSRPLRFPRPPAAAEGSQEDPCIKVDIMEKVGSGYLVLKPLEAGGTRYQVDLRGGGLGGSSLREGGKPLPDLFCELEVSDAAGLPAQQPLSPEAGVDQ